MAANGSLGLHCLGLIRPVRAGVREQQVVAWRAARDEDMEIVRGLDDWHASTRLQVVFEYLHVLGTNAAVRHRVLRARQQNQAESRCQRDPVPLWRERDKL